MNIIRISRKRDQHKKRVAAYCRVSTLLEEQEDSIETQSNYYQSYIASSIAMKNPASMPRNAKDFSK